MAKFAIDTIKQSESDAILGFDQDEYGLFQLFFKSDSPLVLYYANINKQLTVAQSESSDYGHAIRHINVDRIPYVNEYQNVKGIGSHDGLMKKEDKESFDQMLNTFTGGSGESTTLGSTLIGDDNQKYLLKIIF